MIQEELLCFLGKIDKSFWYEDTNKGVLPTVLQISLNADTINFETPIQ